MQIRHERGRIDAERNATEYEIKAALQQHPEIRTAVAWYCNHVQGKTAVATAPACFAMYQMMQSDPEKALAFRDAWASGANLHATHPILILRNHLQRRRYGDVENNTKARFKLRGVFEQAYQAAVIIKAWNAFVAGQEMRAISWSPGEKFPKVK